MPNLDWIGKNKIINHHIEVPFKTLRKIYTFGNNKDISENMIIHGDNLVALKSLMLKYENGIDCIYIDPPYNTGEEKWVYNDNVNDPRIKKWLGDVVGKEGEDFSRHDKWLCMMYPRLKLLQKLLKDDGRIFISIDEHELYNLKCICDEIFGEKNFVGQFMWFKSATPPNLSYKLKKNLEYVLCYEKNKNNIKYQGMKKSSPSDDPFTKPQNTIKTLKFKAGTINFKGNKNCVIPAGVYGTQKFPNKLLNDLIIENGKNKNDVEFENRFIWVQQTLDENIEKNVTINLSKNLVLSYKRAEYSPEVPPNLIDSTVGVSTTEEAGKLLNGMFGKNVFQYPKDVSLINYLLSFVDNPNAVVLDSFAGSGTTAHSVLELNNKDNGNRKFILIEMMDYADSLTAERVKKVINGYEIDGKEYQGINGDFSYYELDQNMFENNNVINSEISKEKLREYIYFTETKKNISIDNLNDEYFLGENDNTGYYLIFDDNGENILNYDFLSKIKVKYENYVIYADKTTLSDEELIKFNIIFKKLSRDMIKC